MHFVFYSLLFCRKCYELRPNCPVIAYKSANGLMRLPGKYQEVKLIKKIISESEKKFPNSGFGNLVCAFYHQRINKVSFFFIQFVTVTYADLNEFSFFSEN